jgi:O-glycosyl hydrolase
MTGFTSIWRRQPKTRPDSHAGRPVRCRCVAGVHPAVLALACAAGLWAASPAVASTGGAISGTVTSAASSSSITGIEVCAFETVAPYAESCKTTSGTGEYTISELPAGSYSVSFFAPASSGLNYVWQAYATTVSVTAGVTTPHIDAALKAGAQITGKVVAEGSKAPIEGIEVCAYPVGGASEFEGFFGECAPTPTNASGEYTIPRLAAGEYKVQFYAPYRGALNYLGQYYSGKHSYAEAEVLHLTAGATTSGIDATLAPGGEISGRAISASSKSAIAGLEVCARPVVGEIGNCAVTDASGAYTIAGLSNGNYRVQFAPPYFESTLNYLTQYYNGKANESEADQVAVTVGGITPNVDAAMQAGGEIRGTVTGAPSKGALTGVQVCASGPASRCATTNASGEYVITGLPSGSYTVHFYGTTEYAPQYYKAKVYSSEAQAVSITAGSSTPAIDAELQPGATISGTVTAAVGSAPLEGVDVCRTAVHEEFFSSCTSTNAQGEYSFAELASTEYKISFSSYTRNYLTQYYHGKASLAEAEPVAVAPGETKSGINAAMQAGGQITGTVTSVATKLPVSGANVAVYTAALSYLRSATTNAKGEYTVPGLATGTYKVSFEATSQNLVAEYYNQKPYSNEATGVEVTTGTTTSGIDAAMALGGELKGKVIDATTKAPLADVSVLLAGNTTAFGYTNAAGEYDVKALSPGSYTASFFATGYEVQYYNGKTKLGEATPVAVAAGSVTESINAAMQSLGSISGVVTDGTTHAVVVGVQVCDYREAGGLVTCTSTNGSGQYTFSGLTAGNYTVGFFPGEAYLSQYYNGKPSSGEATKVAVAQGAAVTEINAALQAGGQIKGTVTSKSSGLPLSGIDVCVQPITEGLSSGCTATAANGTYDVGQLQTGSYQVDFYPAETANYLQQFFNGKGKFSEAEAVAVTAGAATDGINAALIEGGTIQGTVKSAGAKKPLAHAGACAYSSESEAYRCGYTNSNGEYTVNGLPTARYVVYFFSAEGEYAYQYYKEVANEAEATKVAVTSGGTATAIDGQLHVSGRIAGTVTSASTTKALAGIEVCAFSSQETQQECTTSGASGEYVLNGLAPGTHKVEFRSGSQDYETQWFNTKASGSEATLVEVSEEAATEGINAAMIAPGEITGRVTNEGGATGIAGIQVCGFETVSPFAGNCATTGPTGEYDLTKLRGGPYHVSFSAPAGLNYIQQYYHEKKAYEEAEPVTVVAGAATGNIGAALHVGGEITGKVVIAKTTTGIAGIQVCGTGASAGGCVTTNSGGEYTIAKLTTGEYTATFADPFGSSLNYIRQFYNGHVRSSEAQRFAVTAGAATTGINAALEPGGEVSGTVTRIGTKGPLNGITVCAHQSIFDGIEGGEFFEDLDCAETNASGQYTLRGLPAGQVDVEFESRNEEYFTQYYKESEDREASTPVPVEVLHLTTGINARLKATHPIVPEIISLPTISGTAQQGSPLSEHHGSWTHEPEPNGYRYQWFSCNSLGLSCLPVAVENQVYTPVAKDVGSRLEVQEIATNVEGESQPAVSELTAVVVPAKPVNLGPPSFTGSARAGQTLTETHGSWTNEPTSYTYQWERCDSSGENCIFPASSTEQAFKLSSTDVGHTLRVIETAINPGGESAPAVSQHSTVVVPEVPVNVSPPSITGSAVQGKELSESHGTWTNEPTSYGYQWERCSSAGTECTAIAEATSSTYKPTHADVGHKLVIAETASNSGGASKPASSGPTLVVVAAAPVNTSPPTVTGFTQEGATLSDVHGSWTNEPTSYSYKWLRCTSAGKECKAISGATEEMYTLEEADIGHRLLVEEVAANEAGSGTGAFSPLTEVVVAAAPVNTALPTITGTPRQGETLKEARGGWTNSPTSYDIEWQRCDLAGENCVTVTGGSEANKYGLTAEDLGHTIRVVETASNAGGPSSPATSKPTARVVAGVPVNTAPPSVSGHTTQNETLTEAHGTWTNEPSSFSYQWERCTASGTECKPIGGATEQTYLLSSEDVGHKLIVVETAHNAGGDSKPQASALTAVIGPPVPVNTARPTITGIARVGATLTEEHGSWTNSPTGYTYQWERCTGLGFACLPIKGATHQTYVLEAADLGSLLVVQETASNITGAGTPAVSSPVGPVTLPPPVNTAAPTITGSPESGQTLLVTHGSWTNGPTEYREQWLRCDSGGGSCVPIHDAINLTYAPAAADVGHTLRVQETASGAGGLGEPANSQTTSIVSAAPLHANAGENIEATTGTPVTLDGSGSTPASEITAAHWEFGDGSSGEGEIVHHTYASPGKYAATLTIERGGEANKQSITVVVNAPPEHEATITALDEGKHPLEGVEVLYQGPGGGRIEGTTDSAGHAKLAGLPDGTDTVYVNKEGYKPAVGQVSVSGGGGEATVTLPSGPIGEAHLKSHEMTLKEIEEAGINVSDPANQNVYEFEIELAFGHLKCHVNSEGEFVGLETCSGGGGVTWTHHGGYGEGGGVGITGAVIKGHPVIETLVLGSKVTVLKQFFAVSMTISNLSPEPFKFTHGQGTLTVPNGMSLAPTPKPQSASQGVADIPGGGSAETNWIIRGDTPGEYYLSASYHGQLEPFEAPIELQAATNEPLKVWGAEALGFHIQADSGFLQEGVPYHVHVGIVNKANIPLYNVAVHIDGTKHLHFIYQPDQQFDANVGELKPGETIYAPQDILVPDAKSAGAFEPENSSAHFVGETVHPGRGIEAVTPPPLYAISAPSDTPHFVHLHWQSSPAAEGYEIFSTPSLETAFAQAPDEVLTSPSAHTTSTKLPASATDAYLPGNGSESFYAVTSIIGGHAVLNHTVIRGSEGDEVPYKAGPFQLAFHGATVKTTLPAKSVATYIWTPGSRTVSWSQVTANRTALKLNLEPHALRFAAANPLLPTIAVDATGINGQTVGGFGGAMTDSSAYLINSSPKKAAILKALFTSAGANFNMVRLPLGASDFMASPHPSCDTGEPKCYAPNPVCATNSILRKAAECFQTYDDTAGDRTLTHFSIAHDRANTIPVLRNVHELNPAMHILATPWSAAGWMKSAGKYLSSCSGSANYLKPADYTVYAKYLTKVARAYQEEGLPFSSVSMQNEPHNCNSGYPTMMMEPSDEASFSNYLYKELHSTEGGLKQAPEILGWDHNWNDYNNKPGTPCKAQTPSSYAQNLFALPNEVSLIGYHSYCGLPYEPQLPEGIGFYVTESTGTGGNNASGNLVFEVAHELMDPLRDGAKGSLYWNVALDPKCGPQFGGGFKWTTCPTSTSSGCGNCRPMVTVNNEHGGSYYLNEDYYYWAQFSKYIQRGAVRISSSRSGPLDTVAFRNPGPNGSIVVVALNE